MGDAHNDAASRCRWHRILALATLVTCLWPAARAVAEGLEMVPSAKTFLTTARDPEAFVQGLQGPTIYGHMPLTRRDAVVEELLAHAHTMASAEAAATAQTLCDEADRAGFDPLLFVAQIGVESGFNHLALSRVGAEGLMQLMPGTAEFLAARGQLAWPDNHTFDPQLNVTLGVRYMAELRRMFDGNLAEALTAYNRGPAATRQCLARHQRQLPAAVRAAYADRVLAHYRTLHRRYGHLPSA